MSRREKITYVVLLVGVLIGLPTVPALATVAFMTGQPKRGTFALTCLFVWCTIFVYQEAGRRLALGKPPLLPRRKRRISSQLFETDLPVEGVADQIAAMASEAAVLVKETTEMQELDQLLNDADAVQAVVDEKTLLLIGSITAARTESNSDVSRMMLRSLLYPDGRFSHMHSITAFKAASELVVYMVAALAKERGESFEETWQREATTLSRIISDRKAP